MSVNDGSGTAISWSQIQSFYGGSNPISISEYYRGGGEVPSTHTVTEKAAASASNTATNQQNSQDTTTGQLRLRRTYDPVTSQSGQPSQSNGVVNYGQGNKYWVNNQGTNAQVMAFVGQTADSSDPNYNVRLNAGLNVNDDGQITGCGGGNIVAQGNTSGAVVWTGTVSANQAVCVTGGNAGISWNTLTQSITPQWDFRLDNNSSSTVNLTATLGGAGRNDSSFTPGENKQANNRTISSWSWSHPVVQTQANANTAVPQSGTINANVFNSPGNAQP